MMHRLELTVAIYICHVKRKINTNIEFFNYISILERWIYLVNYFVEVGQ